MANKIPTDAKGVVISAVAPRLVKNGTMTLWDVTTADGTKWTAFTPEVGNAAMALVGQPADLKASIEQNGTFTNYIITGITPSAAGVSTPVGQAAVAAAQAQQAGPVVSFDQFKSGEQEKEERKNLSIHRQVAAKVAAQMSDNPQEFWSNVGDLVIFFQTGQNPWANVQQPSVTSHAAQPLPAYTGPAVPPPQPPQAESQAESQAPPHTDDDIPF